MRLKMGAVRACPLPGPGTRTDEIASPEELSLLAALERDLLAWEVAIAVVTRAMGRSKRVSPRQGKR